MDLHIGGAYRLEHRSERNKDEFSMIVDSISGHPQKKDRWVTGTIISGHAGEISEKGSIISLLENRYKFSLIGIDEENPAKDGNSGSCWGDKKRSDWASKYCKTANAPKDKEKEEIEKMTDVEKVEVLYETMKEILQIYFEETYGETTVAAGFDDSAAEQAIWWYCNDHKGPDGTAVRGVLSISDYKPSQGETNVSEGVAMDFYEELASMN